MNRQQLCEGFDDRHWMSQITLCVLLTALGGCTVEISATLRNSDETLPNNAPQCATLSYFDECDGTKPPVKSSSVQIEGIAANPKEDVFLAFRVQGSNTFGGQQIITDSRFVSKLKSTGEHIWSKGCANLEANSSIAVNNAGDVAFVAGIRDSTTLNHCLHTLRGDVTFNPPTLNYLYADLINVQEPISDFAALTPKGSVGPEMNVLDTPDRGLPPSSLLVKLDQNGNYVWDAIFNGHDMIAKFDGDHVIVSGHEDGSTADCAAKYGFPVKGVGWRGCVNHDGTTEASWFVSKFDGQGQRLWTQRFSKPLNQPEPIDTFVHAVAPSGDVFVAGSFRSSVHILGETFQSSGERDVFIAHLTPDGGDIDMISQITGNETVTVTDMMVAFDGLPVVVGSFSGTLNVQNDPKNTIESLDSELRAYATKPDTKNSGFLKLIGVLKDPKYIKPRVYAAKSEILVSGVQPKFAEGCAKMSHYLLVFDRWGQPSKPPLPMPPVNDLSSPNIATSPNGTVFVGGNLAALLCPNDKVDDIPGPGFAKLNLLDPVKD